MCKAGPGGEGLRTVIDKSGASPGPTWTTMVKRKPAFSSPRLLARRWWRDEPMTQPDTTASEEQDAKLIRNERAKLLATAFNTGHVLRDRGIADPARRDPLRSGRCARGDPDRIARSGRGGLSDRRRRATSSGKACLERDFPIMTANELFFILTPLVIAAIGYGIAVLYERMDRKSRPAR